MCVYIYRSISAHQLHQCQSDASQTSLLEELHPQPSLSFISVTIFAASLSLSLSLCVCVRERRPESSMAWLQALFNGPHGSASGFLFSGF